MNSYMITEQGRLQSELADLDQRLEVTHNGPGLKARSVRSFLAQLRRHKSEMLKDIDYALADSNATVN